MKFVAECWQLHRDKTGLRHMSTALHGKVAIAAGRQMGRGALLDVSSEDFQAAFVSGPLATFQLMRLCWPHRRRGGVVLNFGSGAGIRPDPVGYGCYAAVKEAIRPFPAQPRWSGAARGSGCIPSCRSRPVTLTAWASERPEESQKFFESIPLGRVGDPEADIGRAVVFLCCPDGPVPHGQHHRP